MNISSRVSNSLFGSYNSSSLRKIQINTSNHSENIDRSLKELKAINKGKILARENLDATYNSNINKKFQESLEHKLSQLNEMKGIIENKDKENDVLDDSVKNTKVISYINNSREVNDKEETLLSENEQISIQDINKKIAETNSELKEVRVLGKELSQQSEIIELETQLKDKLNQDQQEDKKEI